jgi:hypothetical protein
VSPEFPLKKLPASYLIASRPHNQYPIHKHSSPPNSALVPTNQAIPTKRYFTPMTQIKDEIQGLLIKEAKLN